MAPTIGTIATLASTELNSLANGSGAAGAEYDNATNKYTLGTIEIVFGTGSNATAGNTVDIYIVPAPDGTNYPDGVGTPSQVSAPQYVGSGVCRAATSHRLALNIVPLPLCKFKVVVVNGSGQAFSSSGNTVKLLPWYV